VVNDRIGQTGIVLVAGRAAGVRAYERGDTEFHAPEAGPGATVLDDAGDAWQVTEEALVHPDGRPLERRPGHLSFWFGWFSFYPHTSLYGIDE
jgi:hypothetical protein